MRFRIKLGVAQTFQEERQKGKVLRGQWCNLSPLGGYCLLFYRLRDQSHKLDAGTRKIHSSQSLYDLVATGSVSVAVCLLVRVRLPVVRSIALSWIKFRDDT